MPKNDVIPSANLYDFNFSIKHKREHYNNLLIACFYAIIP